ncbi:MAG: hypothetical protein L0H94_10000, partial [Nitrospira sp.]|nr:hypothetical protein [Nitrospira sp.]
VTPKADTISFEYNAVNELVKKTLPGSLLTNYGYDTVGNLTSLTDSDSALTMTYDGTNRLLTTKTDGSPNQPSVTLTYTYDKNGNRLTAGDSTGTNTSVYDVLNRLTSLTSPAGSFTFNYDALSRRTSLTLPNGTSTIYSYDPASQVTNILHQITASATQINKADYLYNGVGNRTSLTDRRGPQAFGYDTLDRLTSASHPLLGTPQAFAYDPVGNRTTGDSVVNAGNQLTADANHAYVYDDNGNLTRKTLLATGNYTQYTYDAENRLTKVEDFVAGNPTPAATSTYRYDGLGRRIEKVANGQTKRYIYDGEDILLEYDGANVLQARYTHGPGIDEPIAMTKGGSTFFYHQDGLGTVTDLSDSAGATAKSYSYDAHGNIVDQTGTVDQPYTYTGREFDSESGLYYLRARSFDPIAGRFFQKDPIGLRGGLNLYRYAFDNPVRFTDPRGTDVWAGFEGSGIVMAGIGGFQGGGGTMINTDTGEWCGFTLTCGRVGLGLILGAGGKGFGQLFAPRCGKDGGGWSVALAGDIIVPGFSGFGGSVGGGGSLGVGAAVGPDVGAGIAAGVDFCYVKIQGCVNTPPDCQDCSKSK